MKYSEDYKIREWQGRHDEIERILREIDKYCCAPLSLTYN